MTVRARGVNLPLYRGDDFDAQFGMWYRAGGIIGTGEEGAGGTLTSGSDQLVLPDGVFIRRPGKPARGFNDDDIGEMITLMTGSGLADGVTITAVDPDGRSATLSDDATEDRTADAAFVVRARDLTGFTITGMVRRTADGAKLFDLPFDTARYEYGIVRIFIPSYDYAVAHSLSTSGTATTRGISEGGGFDIQFVDTTSGRTATPIIGTLTVEKDWTHP